MNIARVPPLVWHKHANEFNLLLTEWTKAKPWKNELGRLLDLIQTEIEIFGSSYAAFQNQAFLLIAPSFGLSPVIEKRTLHAHDKISLRHVGHFRRLF